MSVAVQDITELQPLLEQGLVLIPLHRPDTKRDGKYIGKSPFHKGWPARDYSGFDARDYMDKGGNVGVRLDNLIVVDADPRNYENHSTEKDDPVERLMLEGLVPRNTPCVETGGGGIHLYMYLPPGVDASKLKERLQGFEGIEFKTGPGRQVVAPGSIHPETGQKYEYDFLSTSWKEIPPAPDCLIKALSPSGKPNKKQKIKAGHCSPELLSEALEGLDPRDFRDYDDWLKFMMACHAATNGMGREVFIEWSISDEDYLDHAQEISNKWDGFDADRHDGITIGTLIYTLRKFGKHKMADRIIAGDHTLGNSESEEQLDPHSKLITEMNETFCAVLDSGGFSIFMRDEDPAFGRSYWKRLSRESFRHYFEDEKLTINSGGKFKVTTKAQLWLEHKNRKKHRGIVMDPQKLPKNKGKLNLWQGWSVTPERGDWSLMRSLIEDVLCDGNTEASQYVIRWIAFMLQKPWKTPGAAIAFKGKQGTGKGTLGRALMQIAGTHGLTVASASQLSGRFNDHCPSSDKLEPSGV